MSAVVMVVGGSGYLGSTVVSRLEAAGSRPIVVSRQPAPCGEWWRGDLTEPGLGLGAARLDELRRTVTHVVMTAGSVSWDASPTAALAVHERGVDELMRICAGADRLERFVLVSSLLALGEAGGVVRGAELHVDQRFRNWYEVAKHRAEDRVRAEPSVPWRVVRFGPLLGVGAAGAPHPDDGICAALAHLLRGYPVHLARGGDFPFYVGEVNAAADVVVAAAHEPGEAGVWSWFDPALPTAAEVLADLCAPWKVVPRLVDAPILVPLTRLFGRRLGVSPRLLDYCHPWIDVDPAVLDGLPLRPVCRPRYVFDTGAALANRPRVGVA
jgi:nucleoside-diphosphate-sugar epimerase